MSAAPFLENIAAKSQLGGTHSSRTALLLQRKCACGATLGLMGVCEKCSKTKSQRTALNREPGAQNDSAIPPIIHEVLSSPGRPLDLETRTFMERRFGYDFGQVRVHTGTKATESSHAINALAYTFGQHVVLGPTGHDQRSSFGRFLLAHELTHVAQQGDRSMTTPLRVSHSDDYHEREALVAPSYLLTNFRERTPTAMTRGVATGTVQKGWPVIAAAFAAGTAAGYGSAAKSCLEEKCVGEGKPMYVETYGLEPDRKGGFRRWYYDQTGAPVPSPVWDAFGHCFAGCCGTKECGAFSTAVAGKGREFYRELEHVLGSKPHDSYAQDTKNQTRGRSYGAKGMDCTLACQAAALSHELDLTAPITKYWTPTKRTYLAPIAELTSSLKSDTDIRYWITMHRLSNIRTIPVQEKIRLINRLLNGWVSKADIGAIEKVCASVSTAAEMEVIDNAIGPRAIELDFGQREQLRIAIGRRP